MNVEELLWRPALELARLVRERAVSPVELVAASLARIERVDAGLNSIVALDADAALATGRRRFVAFQGGYHGDSYGALLATSHPAAPGPIAAQVSPLAIHVPYPYPHRCPLENACGENGCDLRCLDRAFEIIDRELRGPDPPGAVIVETARPDAFYSRLTQLAASGDLGAIVEVASPDDNLQAVFQYLVKT